MSFIEGTATISLETLDDLRECKASYRNIRNTASGLIERIDSEQYEKKQKEIDAIKEISNDELTRLLNEARSTLKIVVNMGCLRRLIREFMDSEKSDDTMKFRKCQKKNLQRFR